MASGDSTATPLVLLHATGTSSDVRAMRGIMGGVDAGVRLADGLHPDGCHGIAPSRFGYLGTPMPDMATVKMQADAHAALLEASACGASLSWPRRPADPPPSDSASAHPERITALILLSSVAPGPCRPAVPRPVARVVWGADFVVWAMARFIPGTITGRTGRR